MKKMRTMSRECGYDAPADLEPEVAVPTACSLFNLLAAAHLVMVDRGHVYIIHIGSHLSYYVEMRRAVHPNKEHSPGVQLL
jgi:hypothetical protein